MKVLIPAAAVMLAACTSPQLTCPSYQGASPLLRADVIDGPPSEMAFLKPDTSTGDLETGLTAAWNVAYIQATGRKLHVTCHYAGTSNTLTLSTSAPIQTCTFQTQPPQPASLTCR